VGTNKSVHWVFSFNSTNGSDPTTLIQGADGNLYGTTADGGAQNFGTVFSISTNGQLVWSYSFPTSQQAYPLQQLVQGSDGRLYGATGRVGAFQIPSSAGGSVFSITTNGAPAWSYVFATRPVEPSPLLLGLDGNLYGVAQGALAPDSILFSMTTNGIWNGSFAFDNIGDEEPEPTLFQGSDGTLYGGCSFVLYQMPLSLSIARQPASSTNFLGTSASFIGTAIGAAPPTYQWQKNGTDLTDGGTVSGSLTCDLQLTNLSSSDEGSYTVIASNSVGVVTSAVAVLTVTNPMPPTIISESVIGVTVQSANLAASVAPNGVPTTVWFQWGTSTNYGNVAGVTNIGAGGGALTGTGLPATCNLGGLASATLYHVQTVASNSVGSTYGLDEAFLTPGAAANWLFAPILQLDQDQSLIYNSAVLIQGFDGNLYVTTQAGSLYSLTTNGVINWTYSFDTTTTGSDPGALVQGADGNLYVANDTGSVVSTTTNGVLNWASFIVSGIDSQFTALTQGSDGNLYGALWLGALSDVVFSLTTNAALNWTNALNSTEGGEIVSLVEARGGDLYGAAQEGGTWSVGTIFCLSTNGSFNWAFSFDGTNGTGPSSVLQGADGHLYGTASGGGAFSAGTIFSMTTNGVMNWVLSFDGTNGATPLGTLVQGPDGRLYGTAADGGVGEIGTIFAVTTNGVLEDLYFFPGGDDGNHPFAGLALGINGTFFGGTISGGADDYGVIFQLYFNPPPVAFAPPTSAAGMITLGWSAQPQHTYQVQWTGDLGEADWRNLGNPIANTSGNVTVTDSIGGVCRFYRIVQTQ
jgi:uncharacterized repeat protein (TIGR03803 family)